MSSAVPDQQGGVVVVTQMYPTPSQTGVVCNQLPQQMCTRTGSFVQSHPLALGTAQIMIGAMVLLFGVVSAVGEPSLGVYSGFFVWGVGFYITAGSLTVAAGKSTNRCLINTTLAFNVIATLAACSAIILYSIDAAVMRYCYYDDNYYDCYRYKTQRDGVSGVLAVFHFLEFIITIVVSAFACKSTCTCCHKQQQQQPVYIIPNASVAHQAQPTYSPAPATVVQLPSQGLPTYPAAPTSMAHPPPQGLPTYLAAPTSMAHPPPQMMNVSSPAGGQSFPGMTDPPEYSEEIKHP